jgi:hypothetical protein
MHSKDLGKVKYIGEPIKTPMLRQILVFPFW